MSSIAEIRAKYPQYSDMSDKQLADALHQKHYSDMPVDEFYSKVGLRVEPQKTYSGSVLPLSRYDDGSVKFDSDAGVLGPIKRGFNLPGEVLAGEVDPMSQDGIDRALEMSAIFTPSGVAGRHVGAMMPGRAPVSPKNIMRFSEPPAPPDSRALLAAGKKGYRAMRQTNAKFAGSDVGQQAIKIGGNLVDQGYDRVNAPQTINRLVDLGRMSDHGDVDIRQLHNQLKRLRSIGRKATDPSEKAAADMAAKRLSSYLGQDKRVGPLLSEADGNWAAAKRSGTYENQKNIARLQTGKANSGNNIGNKTRDAAYNILTNDKKSAGLVKSELNELDDIIMGSKGANRARSTGNVLGGGGGLGQFVTAALPMSMAGAGAIGSGAGLATSAALVGAAAIPAGVGVVARKMANTMSQRAFDRALNNVRMRSPLYRRMLDGYQPQHLSPATRQAMARAADGLNRALVNELMAERAKERASLPGGAPRSLPPADGQAALRALETGALQADYY